VVFQEAEKGCNILGLRCLATGGNCQLISTTMISIWELDAYLEQLRELDGQSRRHIHCLRWGR